MFYHEKIDVKVKRKENYKKQQAQTELQLQLTGLDLRGMFVSLQQPVKEFLRFINTYKLFLNLLA